MNKKELLIVLSIFFITISIFIIIAILASKGWKSRIFHNTRIIDGKEYVAIEDVQWRLRKEVYYYDEFNIFAYNINSLRIEEFYDVGKGTPEYRKYYLENGEEKIIYYEEKENTDLVVEHFENKK